jgi:hypothetical protein
LKVALALQPLPAARATRCSSGTAYRSARKLCRPARIGDHHPAEARLSCCGVYEKPAADCFAADSGFARKCTPVIGEETVTLGQHPEGKLVPIRGIRVPSFPDRERINVLLLSKQRTDPENLSDYQ